MRWFSLCLLGVLLVSTRAAAEKVPACAEKQARLEELKAKLSKAQAAREEWVAKHCKLVKNGGPSPGRHWICDGKFAGNEGDIIKSVEEIRLEARIASVDSWITVCCQGNPPGWCRR